jgi:hypothetical protein
MVRNRVEPDLELDQSEDVNALELSPVDEIVEHEWQLYEMTPENYKAGRKDLQARERLFGTSKHVEPSPEELRVYAARRDLRFGMLQHFGYYFDDEGKKKKKLFYEHTKLVDFPPPREVIVPEQPPPPPASAQAAPDTLTPNNVREIVNEELAMRRAPQPVSQPAPADPFEQATKYIQLLKEGDAYKESLRPPTPAPVTRVEREENPAPVDPYILILADHLKENGELKNRVIDFIFSREPASEESGGLAGIAKSALADPAASLQLFTGIVQGVSLLMQLRQSPQQSAPAEAQPNAPQIAQQHAPPASPLAPVLQVVVEDCTSDAPVDRAHDVIESLLKSNPQHVTQIQMVFSLSPVEVLNAVAQLTGARYLPRLPHAVRWVDELKESFNDEGEDTEAAGDLIQNAKEVEPSLNGNGVRAQSA